MRTVMIAMDPAQPDATLLARLGARLRAGELVAFPTETVYGLGADATNARAVRAIFAAKGRPATDPLIVHIPEAEAVFEATGYDLVELSPLVRLLAERFWPGPLTLILPRGPRIPDEVTAGLATVGVRVPEHPLARALIAAAGVPIAAPSANRFGHTSPTTAQHVLADLDARIPWIVDGGPCPIGVESTILDVTRPQPVLLRPGGVPIEAIEAATGLAVIRRPRQTADITQAALAPGMLLTHYAPRTPLLVIEGDDVAAISHRVLHEIRQAVAQGRRVGALVPSESLASAQAAGASHMLPLGAANDPAQAARQLFAGLRALDDANVDMIICGSFPDEGIGRALRDRLWRAASGHVIALQEDENTLE